MNNSLITGFGSKNWACEEIGFHKYIPVTSSNRRSVLYVEPFFFTGAVFWRIRPYRAIVNDLNDNVYSLMYCLRERYEDLLAELSRNYVGKVFFDDLYSRKDDDIVAKAVLFYMNMVVAFSGNPRLRFNYKFDIKRFRKDLSRYKSYLDGIPYLQIWNVDYKDIYNRILNHKEGNKHSFVIYSDPPYVEQGHHYVCSFDEDEHYVMAELHNKLAERDDVSLYISYDDHPLIREMYDGWYIKRLTWFKSAAVHLEGYVEKDHGELLISNREIKKHGELENFL